MAWLKLSDANSSCMAVVNRSATWQRAVESSPALSSSSATKARSSFSRALISRSRLSREASSFSTWSAKARTSVSVVPYFRCSCLS